MKASPFLFIAITQGILLSGLALAQSLPNQSLNPPITSAASTTPTAAERFLPDYVLGPGDQIVVHAEDAEELSERPALIDAMGFVALPLLGRVHAAGQSVSVLEAALLERLKEYVKAPHVAVGIAQFRTEPVFLVGAFRSPGIHGLQGRHTLIETIAESGGLTPNASRRLVLTRRNEAGEIPLAHQVADEGGKTHSVEIDLNALMNSSAHSGDIELKAYDLIKVPTTGVVYMNGELLKTGPLELNERESLPMLEALSLAGGVTRDAAPDKAVVLRLSALADKREAINVDVKRILLAKSQDFRLQANDIVYIPSARGSALKRTMMTTAPGVATSLIVSLLTR